MNDPRDPIYFIEPERYELHSGEPPRFSRRKFFQAMGGGLLVIVTLREAPAYQESGGGRRGRRGRAVPRQIGAWIHIGADSVVTVYTGKVEVGQNIRTSLTQAVCDELHVAPGSVRLVMGDTNLTPFDMGTFGSRTTPTMAPQLRRASAAARELLLDLAAEAWNADRASLAVDSGKIVDRTKGRPVEFGRLTEGRKLVKEIRDDESITPAGQWTIAGTSVPKVNALTFVTGTHKFPSDMRLPGMLYGKIVRPAAFSATLASLDAKQAEAISGVTVVRDGDFVGVAAPSEQTASRAAAAIRAEWKSDRQPSGSELFRYLREHSSRSQSVVADGSVKAGLAAGDKKLKQTYTVAYIAHTPLEPRAALAQWDGGRLTVWTGTQRPFGVRQQLAEAFGLSEKQVRVIMPDTGAGYGGKHTGEAAIEAARLARAAGKPVKLVWTREEEFTWAYFRPAGVIEVTSAARRDGVITAWEFHNYNSGGAGIRTPYEIENQTIEFHPAD